MSEEVLNYILTLRTANWQGHHTHTILRPGARPQECRKHSTKLLPTSSVRMLSMLQIVRLGGGHVSPRTAKSLARNILLASTIASVQNASLLEAVALGRSAHDRSQIRAQRRRPVNTVNLWGGVVEMETAHVAWKRGGVSGM